MSHPSRFYPCALCHRVCQCPCGHAATSVELKQNSWYIRQLPQLRQGGADREVHPAREARALAWHIKSLHSRWMISSVTSCNVLKPRLAEKNHEKSIKKPQGSWERYGAVLQCKSLVRLYFLNTGQSRHTLIQVGSQKRSDIFGEENMCTADKNN